MGAAPVKMRNAWLMLTRGRKQTARGHYLPGLAAPKDRQTRRTGLVERFIRHEIPQSFGPSFHDTVKRSYQGYTPQPSVAMTGEDPHRGFLQASWCRKML
jgi:hypothetical protein